MLGNARLDNEHIIELDAVLIDPFVPLAPFDLIGPIVDHLGPELKRFETRFETRFEKRLKRLDPDASCSALWSWILRIVENPGKR